MSYKIRLPMGPPEYGEFNKTDFDPEKHAGCDGFMYISVLWPKDGTMSVSFAGMDGRTQKPISDIERFKILGFLAYELANNSNLPEESWQRGLCHFITETMRKMIKSKVQK